MRCALGANLRGIAGDAVVEARADRDQEVAVLDRVVGVRGAVHAEHAQRQRSVVSTAPMPISVVTTGMPKACAKLAAPPAASPLMTPPPA